MVLNRLLSLGLAMTALAVAAQTVSAAPLSDISPVDVIKARNATVESILSASGDSVSQETKQKLKDVINSFIDFRELSRLALGKYWDERTAQEKDEFTNVFQQLIRNSSVRKLEIYKADRIKYEAPEYDGEKANVTTRAFKGRKQVDVLYKMHLAGDEWRVYDMEIDGVSTAINYRESFYKQLAKSSYKEMYDKLVKRLEKEK